MKLLKTISSTLYKAGEAVGGIAIFAIFAVMTVHTLSRYLFDGGLIWSDEFSRYAHVWLTMICGALMCLDDSHIRVTVFDDVFPKLVRPLSFLRYLVSVGFGAAMLYYSIPLLQNGMRSVSSNLRISMAVVYACFLISAVLIVLFSTVKIIQFFTEKPEAPQPKEEVA